MNAATWGIVVLVVFPLLQFPVMVYLSRRVETDDEPPPARGYAMYPFDGDRTHPSASAAHSRSPSARTCRRCGTENENDGAFTYCRDCAARL